jgi:hypothetical protein
MTESTEPSSSEEVPENPPSGRLGEWKVRAERYRSELEGRPRVGFLLRSIRRFNQIEGKHLSLVIAMNMFVAIIPLFIVGYAILVAFNPDRSFGSFVVNAFHLTGSTADTVEETFSNARSGRSTALSISVISLLITGLDVSATVQLAYARAFGVAPLAGLRKPSWRSLAAHFDDGHGDRPGPSCHRRGAVSLGPSAGHTGVSVGATRLLPGDAAFAARPSLRLAQSVARCGSRHGRRDPGQRLFLVPVAPLAQRVRHAYGSFGIALSIIAYVGLIALFWVWIAAVMGTYWENKAGSAAVAAMREQSAEAAARS